MHVKEVGLADADERMVICYNPDAAAQDAAIRGRLLTQLEQMIKGTDALSATDRARLSGVAQVGLDPGGTRVPAQADRALIVRYRTRAPGECAPADDDDDAAHRVGPGGANDARLVLASGFRLDIGRLDDLYAESAFGLGE